MMAGESTPHGRITTNLTGIFYNELKGTTCEAFSKDTKVRSGMLAKPRQVAKGMYSYPDVAIVCGEPQHEDEHQDVVTNPLVIVEVLSPATENFDRGEKFVRYRWNETLTDYILISQDFPQVEHFTKQKNGDWLLRIYNGLEAAFAIESINCTLTLRDVYDRLEFE